MLPRLKVSNRWRYSTSFEVDAHTGQGLGLCVTPDTAPPGLGVVAVCPDRPRRVAGVPQGLERANVAQGVHRLPEAAMSESYKFAVGSQALERLMLEEDVVPFDTVEDRRLEHEEPAVHPGAIAHWLLLEGPNARRHDLANNLVVFYLERSEAA